LGIIFLFGRLAMKKIFLLFLFLSLGVRAAEVGTSVILPENSTNLSVGADINNYAGNFGVGTNFTSPYFMHGHAAVRLSMSQNFYRGILAGQSNQSTMRYTTLKLGLIGAGAMVNSLIRLYGGGGLVALLPSGDLSSNNVLAGYGGFGFEFFFGPPNPASFYIELGGMAGGTAEKVTASPAYAGGFTVAAGTRYYF
jgi:hypothetical protein